MANAPLRGCPTCGTPVSELKMGLRDYRWVADALPGRVAPMDIDCMLERKGHFLVMEFKPEGAPLPLGQRLTLKALVNLGMDVWVAREGEKPDRALVGAMNRAGDVPFVEDMRLNRLRRNVSDWYEEASASA